MPTAVLRRCRFLAVIGPVCLLACDGSGFSRAFSVRDSAGVTIVESRRPAWTGDAGWSIPETAAVSVAGTAADQPFGRIVGVVALDNGGIAVADAGDFTLHYFDGAGQLVHTVQPGDAPIMVRALTRLYRVNGEIHLAQRGLAPTLVFDQAGAFLRAVEPPAVEGVSRIAQYQHMADGSILAMSPPLGLVPRSAEWIENAVFFRILANGQADRVLTLPAVRLTRVPSSVQPVGYGPILSLASGPDRMLAGFPERFDIGEYSPDGTLLRRIRRDWEPQPLPAGAAQALRDTLRRMLDETLDLPIDAPELLEEPESQIDAVKIAETMPAHGRLILDSQDHLWVERVPPLPVVISGPFPVRPEPTPWDIFDAEGVWLGTVTTPADTHVTDVAGGAIAGIMRRQGVQRAVLFRFDRGEADLRADPMGG